MKGGKALLVETGTRVAHVNEITVLVKAENQRAEGLSTFPRRGVSGYHRLLA
jgi:hypothetical protein